MKSKIYLFLIVFSCQQLLAQNQPYYGGVGRGDAHQTKTNMLLENPQIYFGGIGRGDVHQMQTNILLDNPLIYYGGIGRGDVHQMQTNILLDNPLIYFGGIGRGDVHQTQTNILLENPMIYFGGIGRGDAMLAKTSFLSIIQDNPPVESVSDSRLEQNYFVASNENLGEMNEVVFYPNPSSSSSMNLLTKVPLQNLRIYTTEGKLVFQEKEVTNSIELKLNPGVYFANYFLNGKQETKRIIFLD